MGKGDKPRNCFSKSFRTNFDEIDWGRYRTIDEVCGLPKGSFKKHLEEKSKQLEEQEKERNRRIRKEYASNSNGDESDGEEDV